MHSQKSLVLPSHKHVTTGTSHMNMRPTAMQQMWGKQKALAAVNGRIILPPESDTEETEADATADLPQCIISEINKSQ